jgi:hypothetical protein
MRLHRFDTRAASSWLFLPIGLFLNLLATVLDVRSKSVHRVAASQQRNPCGEHHHRKQLFHHDLLPSVKGDNVRLVRDH